LYTILSKKTNKKAGVSFLPFWIFFYQRKQIKKWGFVLPLLDTFYCCLINFNNIGSIQKQIKIINGKDETQDENIITPHYFMRRQKINR